MIRYFGFDYPPVGIIDVLEQTAPADAKFFIIDPISGAELPYDKLDANSYVIITTNEGSSHNWFNRLIPMLNEYGVDDRHIIIRSSCLWDPDSPVQHVHTIVDECSDFVTAVQYHLSWSESPTHHFVCLNRGHRWQRYKLVKSLLDHGLNHKGKITYIKSPSWADSRFLTLSGQDIDWQQQRDINDPGIQGALFNVVCETAYEPEPGSSVLTHHHRPGMTEKSYKCFAIGQIPIWLAPYRAVSCYRDLGFDVFDDIVDHSYDLEPDPVQRIAMVANQVQRVCGLSLSAVVDLKHSYQARFEHNWNNLLRYAHDFSTEIPQWQALFLRNNPN